MTRNCSSRVHASLSSLVTRERIARRDSEIAIPGIRRSAFSPTLCPPRSLIKVRPTAAEKCKVTSHGAMLGALLISALLPGTYALATPLRPSNPQQVLLTLTDAVERRQLRELHHPTPIAPTSNDDAKTVALAQQYMVLGRAQADERYYGNAAALLAPLASRPTPSEQTLVLQADILQHQHQFTAAQQMLERVIANNPSSAQAHLMLASIKFSQGRAEQARSDCRALTRAADALISLTCLAELQGLTGMLDAGYPLLSSLHERMTARSPASIVAWMRALLGDMAERRGDGKAAEYWWRATLRADGDDLVTRLALADLLLRQGHAKEVMTLLDGAPVAEGVLLRRALAAKQLNNRSTAEQSLLMWREQVTRNQQLGIALHLREQAIGELQLLNDPQRALISARNNWQTQREAADTRIYFAAARAAHADADLQIIKAWLLRCKLQDASLSGKTPADSSLRTNAG